MGFDTDTAAESAEQQQAQAEAQAPAAADDAKARPLSEVQRAQAAARARKHRALKKLKAAKTEEKLKEVAAEIAAPDEEQPTAPAWPTGEEIAAASKEIGGAVEMAAELLEGTPWALTERKAKILILATSPAAAQAAKNPGASALGKVVTPGVVAVLGILAVFGPPTVGEVRKLVASFQEGAPKP